MNDKLIMESMLLILKSNIEVYVHGTLEASNKKVHDCLKNSLDDTMKLQEELYQKMTECGWYKIQKVEAKEIVKTLQKIDSQK